MISRCLCAAVLATFAVGSVAVGSAEGAEAGRGSGDARQALPAPGTYELPPIARVENFTLLDADGVAAPVLDLEPRQLAVVALIYTSCPSACPAALAILQQVDREIAAEPALAERVRLVTVSFDPELDTPAKMAELRSRMSPRSSWRFLTAKDEAEIAPVLASYGQDALRMVVGGPDDEQATSLIRHVLKVFLVDASGDVRNIYSTGFLSPEMLLTDIRTLLLDAPSSAELAAE